MKKLLVVLLLVGAAFGQTKTTVTGVVQDASGNLATSGTVVFTLSPQNNGVIYFVTGTGIIAPQVGTCGIDGSGNIKNLALSGPCQVWGTDIIVPANLTYQVSLFPNGGFTNAVPQQCITGTTYDLSNPQFCPVIRPTPQFASVITSPIQNNLIPSANGVFSIGSSSLRYSTGFFNNLNVLNSVTLPNPLNLPGALTVGTTLGVTGVSTLGTVNSSSLNGPLGAGTPNTVAATTINASGAVTAGSYTNNLSAFAPTTSSQLAGVISDETGSGPLVFANSPTLGAVTVKSTNAFAVIKVDQYASWALALADCPTAGCILDATSPNSPLAMGSFDVGTKAVTVLLGPLSFTATQITLRTGLNIIGAASGPTVITSVGSNATPLMVIPQVNSTPAQHVHLENINFVGAAGNTSQTGLFADCSSLTNAGLWYSQFKDLHFSGFQGKSIYLKGRVDNANAVNQFLTFTNVQALRSTGAGEALRIENGVGQVEFINSEFDGPGITDGTNIFIGEINAGDLQAPYSINFELLTCQSANLCAQISGSENVTIQNSHFEVLHGAIQTSLVGTTANIDLLIAHNVFFGNVGVNAGNGFILKSGLSSNDFVIFKHNEVFGTADSVVTGANGNNIIVGDNNGTWSSSGITEQISPAATINTGGVHTVLLNASATSITTITSTLGPGEKITFIANGADQFATGGNIDLTGVVSPLVLAAGETVTFVRNDLSGTWRLMATSTAKITGKTLNGANAGNTVNIFCSASHAAALVGNAGDQTFYTCTVPASVVGINKGFEVRVYFKHSTGTASVTYKASFGGTNLFTQASVSHANGIMINVECRNNAATNAQDCVTWYDDGDTAQTFTSSTPAIDTTVNQNVVFTFNVANTDQITPNMMRGGLIQ